jgi:hypothetical protein
LLVGEKEGYPAGGKGQRTKRLVVDRYGYTSPTHRYEGGNDWRTECKAGEWCRMMTGFPRAHTPNQCDRTKRTPLRETNDYQDKPASRETP